MAFPTSSLTNNQVHKEGNRAFVYDSALGVWDQVRETDRTENKIVQGEIGSGTTFPIGHIVKVYNKVFKDRQAIIRESPKNDSVAIADSEYILIGTGATGTAGDPLEITTDTPASASSKWLINSTVLMSQDSGGSLFLRLYGGGAFITDADGLADNGSLDTSFAFGRSHWSTGGGDYGTVSYSVTYLWSPSSASPQTISVKGMGYQYNDYDYINTGTNDGNSAYYGTGTSQLTVMEVA